MHADKTGDDETRNPDSGMTRPRGALPPLAAVLAWSAVLQFPLACVPAAVIALSVYGMSFLTAAGYIVLISAAVLILAHRRLKRAGDEWSLPGWVMTAAGLFLAWAYRPFHMGYHDGRSAWHAGLLFTAGLWSLLAAHHGARAVRMPAGGAEAQPEGKPAVPWALIIAVAALAPVWLCAAAYPLIPLLWCAAVIALAAMLTSPAAADAAPLAGGDPERSGVAPPVAEGGFSRDPLLGGVPAEGGRGGLSFLLFLLAMDFSAVIYDYGVVTAWGVHMAALMLAAAAGASLNVSARRWEALILAAAAVNYVAAVLFPAWILNPLHNVVCGLALGWLLRRLLLQSATRNPRPGISFGVPTLTLALGMAVSGWISMNLALNWLRLVPAAGVILAWGARSRVAMAARGRGMRGRQGA